MISAPFFLAGCSSPSTPAASSSPTTAASPTGRSTGDILFSDDFSDPTSGWPVRSNSRASAGYADDVYRILVRLPRYPESDAASIAASYGSVSVEADVTKAAGAPEGLAYVSCENEQARPSSFTAYLFMIDPDSQGYAIVRLIGSSKAATALAHGSDASKTLRGGSAINHITGVCAGGGAGASTTLTMEVNGRTLAQTTDPRGIGPFDAVGLGVISRAQSGAEFDFDNLVLKKVTGPGTPTPAGAAESTGPSATG